jgi:hypothetical protein
MIMNQDIKPEKQAYYLGSEIIKIIKSKSISEINPFEIFEILQVREKVNYHSFCLAMNWLFLIGVIELKGKEIYKCF